MSKAIHVTCGNHRGQKSKRGFEQYKTPLVCMAPLVASEPLPAVHPSEFDLLLADSRRDIEQRLFDELRDRVRLEDVDLVTGVE